MVLLCSDGLLGSGPCLKLLQPALRHTEGTWYPLREHITEYKNNRNTTKMQKTAMPPEGGGVPEGNGRHRRCHLGDSYTFSP